MPIPDTWMVLLAAVAGKVLMLMLPAHTVESRSKVTLGLALATGVYGGVSLQVYISGQLLLPWLLPSLMIWSYWLPLLLEKNYESH